MEIPSQEAYSVLLDVDWQTGRTGAVTQKQDRSANGWGGQ